MKFYWIIPGFLVVLLLSVACVPNTHVTKADTSLGYFNFAPVIQKVNEQREAACEADAECEKVEPLTQGEILAVLNSVKDRLKADGSVIVGIEFDKSRIWIEKPVR